MHTLILDVTATLVLHGQNPFVGLNENTSQSVEEPGWVDLYSCNHIYIGIPSSPGDGYMCSTNTSSFTYISRLIKPNPSPCEIKTSIAMQLIVGTRAVSDRQEE